jgi:hypothetical protein
LSWDVEGWREEPLGVGLGSVFERRREESDSFSFDAASGAPWCADEEERAGEEELLDDLRPGSRESRTWPK